MYCLNTSIWPLILCIILNYVLAGDDDYNVLHNDGSYEFGYNNPDSYHYADANRNNVVRGEFGGRNPKTGGIDATVYTAGPRGFRPRGKNIARKYDLNQSGPRPIGSRDDPYYDPYEDPSYSFGFRTRTYNRDEQANRVGDVNGRYSYIDDVGERHNVEYIAGKNTGFHVKTPFPDSNPRAYGRLYFNGRGKPIPRGRTSIQRGLDGSYKFVSAGPDQRRTETADATGHVRGSYTYLDDKGIQHSVHYIAGPETGYRVLKNVKGPHLPTVFPFGRPEIIPPDFYDYGGIDQDVFDTAASGHAGRPIGKPGKGTSSLDNNGIDVDKDDFNKFTDDLGSTPLPPRVPQKPYKTPLAHGLPGTSRPSYVDDGADDFDLFGGSSTTARPSGQPNGLYVPSSEDDGSYKPDKYDGSHKPSRPTSTTYRPDFGDFSGEQGTSSTSRPASSFDGGYSTTQRPRPSGTGYDGDAFGKRPTTARPTPGSFGGSTRPTSRPQGGFDSSAYDDFGLFGSESGNARPPFSTTRPPFINIGQGQKCPTCKGTLVTNLGDEIFSVPPGVSVRAHVQSIDLIPLSAGALSPSEAYKQDSSLKTEQLNEAQSNNENVATNSTSLNEVSTTLVPNTTLNSTSIENYD